MEIRFEKIASGSVTSPKGFHAGATYAGIKKKAKGALDLGILFSKAPCAAAGVFTTNRLKAPAVVLSQKRLRSGRAAAVVVNSGCANACTGEEGMTDAIEMADLAAKGLGLSDDEVLVASTGVIGRRLPMKLIKTGLKEIALAKGGGHDLAKAMMTTDKVQKEIAIKVGQYVIGGVTKGSGMIHPNMATMLCFLTSDVCADVNFLRSALRKAVDVSFNMVSVDGDTSPSDTVLLLANGESHTAPIVPGTKEAETFQQALNYVCIYLAKAIATDGEGASKLIETTVSGAATIDDARLAARTVVSSALVKSAVHGSDPNWGRIVAAVGRSGAEMVESRVDLSIGDIAMVKDGVPLSFSEEKVIKVLDGKEVPIAVDLNLGKASATAWGCDLSEEYVKINSQYMT